MYTHFTVYRIGGNSELQVSVQVNLPHPFLSTALPCFGGFQIKNNTAHAQHLQKEKSTSQKAKKCHHKGWRYRKLKKTNKIHKIKQFFGARQEVTALAVK